MNTDCFSKVVVVVDVDLQATRTLSVRDNSYGLACFKEAICLLCDGLRYIVFYRFATASFCFSRAYDTWWLRSEFIIDISDKPTLS